MRFSVDLNSVVDWKKVEVAGTNVEHGDVFAGAPPFLFIKSAFEETTLLNLPEDPRGPQRTSYRGQRVVAFDSACENTCGTEPNTGLIVRILFLG